MSELKKLLDELKRSEIPKGPPPAFSSVHFIKALLLLESKSMGRQTISKMLGLGEGSTRTLVRKLLKRGLVSVDPVGGCDLTESGKSIVRQIRETIISSREVALEELGIELPSCAVQVRPPSIPGISITKLRDIAVRNGAEGMLVFTIKDFKISLPMIVNDISEDYPMLATSLERLFSLKNGDIIFVAFAKDKNVAELGALAVAIFFILES
ncbi:MAG: DUF4443 domain-containing protein [Candidatus Methanomethylicaceae archaeon]